MPNVTYIQACGSRQTVDVEEGSSVMHGAKQNGIEGIEGDCGGVCACATCHVYVDPAWVAAVGEPNEGEAEMLECVNNPTGNSRLSCQIAMARGFDGLVVRLPPSQR